MRQIVYVAGPYTAPTREGIQANIDKAEAIGKMLLLQGDTPLIPHRITGHWDADPRFSGMTARDWMNDVCLPLLDRCDAIIMCPGWINSPGSLQEHQHAVVTGKLIMYFEDDMPALTP
ncbi:DUF1937 family protein [Oryzomonas rubra]|uniref:DUF4406 domain-containing protein n=1 Tax=Oryzomonas rubra TaxID=2509454 RepID=A0A5A9X8D2_9BACT|nr:DUF1937 family protein [Oryzomonas rubra]KAA0888728.1 DUF4406 domain-containing protein [Oryzomonas rubra]